MADESSTAVAEPQSQVTETGEPASPFDFGNIAGAFDNVFRSTAPKEGEPSTAETLAESTPVAPAAQPAKTTPETPVPTSGTQEEDVPDAVFGEPAAKAEPEKPVVLERPKSIKDPKAIENWDQLRGHYDKAQATLAKQAAEIEELRKKAGAATTDEGLKARVAQIEEENKKLLAKVREVDIQSDESFQQHFVVGREQSVNAATAIAQRAGVDPAVVKAALSLTGDQQVSALDGITDDINSSTLKTLFNVEVSKITALDQQKAAVLADAEGSYEKLKRTRQAEQHRQMEEQTANLTKVFDGAADYLREKAGFEVLKKVEGGPEWWNKQADQVVSEARKFLMETADPSQIAMASLLAATSGIHRGLWLKERKARMALAKEVAEFKNAEPGLNGGRGESTGEPGDEKLSFAEAAARGSGLR